MNLILNILNRTKSKMSQRGFTLIELLVVIAIIGILSTIGVISFSNAKQRASNMAMLQQMKNIVPLIETCMSSEERVIVPLGWWSIGIDRPLKEICDGEYFPEPISGWTWRNFTVDSPIGPFSHYTFSATKDIDDTEIRCTNVGGQSRCYFPES